MSGGFLAPQLLAEGVVLDEREVLQQPAERQRRRADPEPEPGGIQPVHFPPECRAEPIECAEQMRDLAAGQRWLPRWRTIGHTPQRMRYSGYGATGAGQLAAGGR